MNGGEDGSLNSWFDSNLAFLAWGAGGRAVVSPYLAVVGCAAGLVAFAFRGCVVALDDADAIPRYGAAHGGHKDIHGLGLVGESKTEGMLREAGRLFSDVAYQPTTLRIGFGANGRFSVCNYREWDIFVYVLTEGEVIRTRLNKAYARGHYG